MRAPVNYCQVCGHEMTDREAYGQVRRVCPACGYIHFDDPKVAAVTLVEHEGRALLVRRAFNPQRGKWSLPGGYVDYGENPAEAAAREVREETGLDVAITELLDVRGGPSPEGGATVIIQYAARVKNGTAHAADDASDIMWLAPDDPLPELAFESTRAVLQAWIAQRRNGAR